MIFKYFGMKLDGQVSANSDDKELDYITIDNNQVWNNCGEGAERFDIGTIINYFNVPFKILVREEYADDDREDVVKNGARCSEPVHVAIVNDIIQVGKGKYRRK